MRFSPSALEIGAPELLRGLSSADIPLGFEEVVAEGWVVERGAVLLKCFRDSYHGDRDRFTDLVGYEVAVNGRAIPDIDLDPTSPDSIRVLLRRGVSFAWNALEKLREAEVLHDVSAYVMVTPMLFNPEQVTGSVTFCSIGPTATPYIQPESYAGGIVVMLDSREAKDALPD